jgi:hypothetical protein
MPWRQIGRLHWTDAGVGVPGPRDCLRPRDAALAVVGSWSDRGRRSCATSLVALDKRASQHAGHRHATTLPDYGHMSGGRYEARPVAVKARRAVGSPGGSRVAAGHRDTALPGPRDSRVDAL